MWTAVAGSRDFNLGGRLSLTLSVEVGLRQDGGDAETGAGMNIGGGLVFHGHGERAVAGLASADAAGALGRWLHGPLRVAVLRVGPDAVEPAEADGNGFTDRCVSLSFGWDSTPSSPLGLMETVAPSWGRSATDSAGRRGAARWPPEAGRTRCTGRAGRSNAEVGYGLPVGARFVGTPRMGLTTSPYGRAYRVGYASDCSTAGACKFEVGVGAQRRESPRAGGANAYLRALLDTALGIKAVPEGDRVGTQHLRRQMTAARRVEGRTESRAICRRTWITVGRARSAARPTSGSGGRSAST